MRLVFHPKVYSYIDKIMGYYERVATSEGFENLEDGAGVDDFPRWFPGVKREQVLAVLEFAEQSLTVA